MCRALVTGAAGFIGSHLCERLLKLGYKVVGVDNLSSGTYKNLIVSSSYKNFRFILNDFVDEDFCKDLCKDKDYIFHHAAYSSVPGSIEKPMETTSINVLETVNLLNAAAKSNVKRFVFASSASVYGNSLCPIKSEDSEIQLLSPYAASKYSCEMFCKMYYNLYDLKTISLRYFNVFGSRQKVDSEYAAVIPKFIEKVKNKKELIVYGDGEQTRDFVHVSDIVEANVKALSLNSHFGEAFNIASGISITVNQLVEEISNGKKVVTIHEEERQGEVKHSMASIEKAVQYLGYEPKISFANGIKETIG